MLYRISSLWIFLCCIPACRLLEQTRQKKIENPPIITLSLDDERRYQKIFASKTGKSTESLTLFARAVEEPLEVPVLKLVVTDGKGQSTPLTAQIESHFKTVFTQDLNKYVMVCHFEFSLKLESFQLNQLLIFGKIPETPYQLSQMTKLDYFSELFVTKEHEGIGLNTDLAEGVTLCKSLWKETFLPQAKDYYEALTVNMIYPHELIPCSNTPHLLANKTCDAWYQKFMSSIKNQAYPLCFMDDSRQGFCQLRSKSERLAPVYLGEDGSLRKIPQEKGDSLIPSRELRFVCSEDDGHYKLQAVGKLGGESQDYACVLVP